MGIWLRRWREDKKTIAQLIESLAENAAIDVSRQRIAAYERGDAMIPIATLVAVARELNVKRYVALAIWLQCNLDESGLRELEIEPQSDGNLEYRLKHRGQLTDSTTYMEGLVLELSRMRREYFDDENEAHNIHMERVLRQVAEIDDLSLRKWELNSSDGSMSRNVTLLSVKLFCSHLEHESQGGRFAESTADVSENAAMTFIIPNSLQLKQQWKSICDRVQSKRKLKVVALPPGKFLDLADKMGLRAGFSLYDIRRRKTDEMERLGVQYVDESSFSLLLSSKRVDQLNAIFDHAWETNQKYRLAE